MDTEHLWILRVIGEAEPKQYVEWACEQLCAGVDSPSLRILAGLNPKTDAEETETFFRRTCSELKLDQLFEEASPLVMAQSIWNAFERGALTAKEAISQLANVIIVGDFIELNVFLSMHGELSEEERYGYYYPPEYLDDLDSAFRLEWTLFLRAQKLKLPTDFLVFHQCASCGHFGETLILDSAIELLGMEFSRVAHNYCMACGSGVLNAMINPEVRDAYFTKLEKEQLGEQNSR